MPIGTIANDEDSASARAKINLALAAVDGLGDASTKAVGTTAGTVAAGDDARLSDARTPTSHTHDAAVAAITYASTITTDASTVPSDHCRTIVALTGDITVNAPTNPTNGKRFCYHLTASGANRTVTLNAAIRPPTGATFDGVIQSGSTRVLELTYLASRWTVTRNLEFVA